MGRNNTFVYLKSNNGVLDEVSRYYRFDFVNPISCNRKKELINVKVCEGEIPLTYYNINSQNNKFKLKITLADGQTGIFSKTFDVGNYNSDHIITELNALADVTAGSNTLSLVVSLDENTYKFNFVITSNSSNITEVEHVNNSTCYKLLGLNHQTFTNSSSSITITGDNVIDFNETNNIYVETDLSLPSLDTNGKKKGILGKIQMSGNFFDIIHWNNTTDAEITLDRKHHYLDHINIRLVGEDNERNIEFNGAEWTLTLLFSFIDKYETGIGEEVEDGVMYNVNPIGAPCEYEYETDGDYDTT